MIEEIHYPPVKGFRLVLDELSKKIPAAKPANPRDFTDTRFFDELDRSGFFEQTPNNLVPSGRH
jgi:hypothetical protein